ncbi:MAG TPA: methyl-accepting chemotaxis protein, partial [Nitrospirota bacterium]
MSQPEANRRKKLFIEKKFQGKFIAKTVLSLIAGLVLSMGLLIYLSDDSLTADYSGGTLKIQQTTDMLLPYIIISNALAIALVAVAGVMISLVYSHRIAGPLYRFEKDLEAIKQGDLTRRIKLRDGDQFSEMAEQINSFTDFFDTKISGLNRKLEELSALTGEFADTDYNGKLSAIHELEQRLADLRAESC